jgi:hypothetical protein
MRHPVRVPDLSAKLRSVMSSEKFQTAYLLCMQIVFPPEVVSRLKASSTNRTVTSLITSILVRRAKAGEFIRRRNEDNIYEYKMNSDFALPKSNRTRQGKFVLKKKES